MNRISTVVLVAALLLATRAQGQAGARWVGSWASSQQIPEAQNALPAADLTDATLRQIVHLSAGGTRLRVHLSNAFGTTALHITAAHVARAVAPASSDIEARSDRALAFGGAAEVTIPPGAEYVSDPVGLPTTPLANLAISLHVARPPAQQTGHPGSRATSYAAHGDQVGAVSLTGAKAFEHWTMVSGVDVEGGGATYSVVTLGDSITDGHGATTNGNDRWPDVLAQRLGGRVGVLNQGIGGNHLLTDGLGPNALARFDRDVLAQAGVRYLLVLEGVNDLGGLSREGEVAAARHAELVRSVEGAYEQMVLRAHAHGLKVIGATILPYLGSDYYHPGAANETDRQAVNAWIRAAGHFDSVIDFDRLTADPQHPGHLLAAFDSGDHLHPSPAGYKAMAQAIPLGLMAPSGRAQ